MGLATSPDPGSSSRNLHPSHGDETAWWSGVPLPGYFAAGRSDRSLKATHRPHLRQMYVCGVPSAWSFLRFMVLPQQVQMCWLSEAMVPERPDQLVNGW